MPERTITAAARDLQAAANRLALMTRNHNRDTILAGLFKGTAKGDAAQARLDGQAPALKALEEEVRKLRLELGALLENVVPPPRIDLAEADEIEPPTKKRRRKK